MTPRPADRPRRAMRALSDQALIKSMREGIPEAWEEFMSRFRPVLEQYARRTGIDDADWSGCVLAVLEDAAMRWAIKGAVLPRSMTAYLVRAVNLHRMTLERDGRRRAQRYERAATSVHGEGVVLSTVSESSIRYSRSPQSDADETRNAALDRFCRLLREPLTDEEAELLARVGDGVPHREIAELLGVSYDAARKRIQRLTARVRDLVPLVMEQLTDVERAEAERFLRRLKSPRGSTRGEDDAA